MPQPRIDAFNEDLARIIGDAIVRKNGTDKDEWFDVLKGRREVVQEILDSLTAEGWTLVPPKTLGRR